LNFKGANPVTGFALLGFASFAGAAFFAIVLSIGWPAFLPVLVEWLL
jgi:hypothetical protein